jgi:hypothetical protein
VAALRDCGCPSMQGELWEEGHGGRSRRGLPLNVLVEFMKESRKIDASIRGCSRCESRMGEYEARRMEERVLTVAKCHVPASER